MARLLPTLTVVVAAASLVQAGHQAWSYDGESGQEHWAEMGFSDCSRHQQSPIAINTMSVVRKRMKPLEFYHFEDIPRNMSLTNNHHSAAAVFTPRTRTPMVRSGGLPGNFEVIGFHFHWGEHSETGSEHTINGKHYPLEMHVVCKNEKYPEVKQAVKHKDGLAVLAVMFKVSEVNNRAIERLDEPLSQISEGGATTQVKDPPTLSELMPMNTNDFYRYNGSLTTPGCFEVVTWTIFTEPVKVTEEQLELFRSLKKTAKATIGHNYRSTQERYGRVIYLRRPEDEDSAEVEFDFTDFFQHSHAESSRSGGARPRQGALAGLLGLLLAARALLR